MRRILGAKQKERPTLYAKERGVRKHQKEVKVTPEDGKVYKGELQRKFG